jgi:hypothetical protein
MQYSVLYLDFLDLIEIVVVLNQMNSFLPESHIKTYFPKQLQQKHLCIDKFT